MSFKIKIRKTDTLFSLYIRRRDNWTCCRCHKKYKEGNRALNNSHYWSRGHESTRFDPENCDAICFGCHNLWGHGDERDLYKKFKIKQLGEEGFKILDVRAHTYKKRDDLMDGIIIKTLMNPNIKMNKAKQILQAKVRDLKSKAFRKRREADKFDSEASEIEKEIEKME